MTKVYVVSIGGECDNRNKGVFITKEKAEIMAKYYDNTDAYSYVEEFELDELNPMIEKGYVAVKVWVSLNGDIGSYVYDDPYRCEEEFDEEYYVVIRESENRYKDAQYNYERWKFFIFAKSDEDAINISEKAKQDMIEMGVWDTAFAGTKYWFK